MWHSRWQIQFPVNTWSLFFSGIRSLLASLQMMSSWRERLLKIFGPVKKLWRVLPSGIILAELEKRLNAMPCSYWDLLLTFSLFQKFSIIPEWQVNRTHRCNSLLIVAGRYNTLDVLDVAEQNRVPSEMLCAPIGNPTVKGRGPPEEASKREMLWSAKRADRRDLPL